ncbi:hypothetical protein T4D_16788 [Trichinella pseudospiralis]|uniref:Uncharacterized protein n=1 Tax=Trichinella pseudospiralis TaxID=6337 RepID=A0A0V1FWR8_TRIPS|nr:hypothetical protein T4D_16788 [Trichinella pseudospiralis]
MKMYSPVLYWKFFKLHTFALPLTALALHMLSKLKRRSDFTDLRYALKCVCQNNITCRYSAIREGCSSSQFRVVFFKFDIYHLKREPTFHQRRSYGRLKSPTGQFYPNQVGLGSSTICDLNFHVTDLVY